jgi:hypothetical protein
VTTADRMAQAIGVLDGTIPVPEQQRVRAAAHLGRNALEHTVTEILAVHGTELGRAWMSSRLTVLYVLAGAETATRDRVAWAGLNRVCHRHAFELPPAEAEVRVLLDHVASLSDPT